MSSNKFYAEIDHQKFSGGRSPITISLDCSGGDLAPEAVIHGAFLATKKLGSGISFVLSGDEPLILNLLKKYKIRRFSIQHTDIRVPQDIRPSMVLRGLRSTYLQSSMALSVKALKDGLADAVVSSGDTGALMVIARYILGLLPGLERPAIIGRMPNAQKTSFAMLDIGANISSNADELYQFALMGVAFARIVFGRQMPKLGILNVGHEDSKGTDVLRSLAQSLKSADFRGLYEFIGYVEPHKIFMGGVDVVVCEGFVGNVSLKTLEGTASMIRSYLREAFSATFLAKIGYFLAQWSLKKTLESIDPRNSNGALLIGLNSIVVKSHGSSDAFGFANAIFIAHQLVKSKLNNKILEELEHLDAGVDRNNSSTPQL